MASYGSGVLIFKVFFHLADLLVNFPTFQNNGQISDRWKCLLIFLSLNLPRNDFTWMLPLATASVRYWYRRRQSPRRSSCQMFCSSAFLPAQLGSHLAIGPTKTKTRGRLRAYGRLPNVADWKMMNSASKLRFVAAIDRVKAIARQTNSLKNLNSQF